MSKQIIYNEEALLKLNDAAKTLAQAVSATLGPYGRTVVLQQNGTSPSVTKDGATVAGSITLEDAFEHLGAELMKQVSSKTEQGAEDGTTTSIIIAQAMLQEGIKYVVAGVDPREILSGLQKGIAAVVADLKNQSVPVTNQSQIEQIAITACNNDTVLGLQIAAAYKNDKDVRLLIEESKGVEQELVFSKGAEINYGFASRHFADAGKIEAELDDCYVMVTDIALNKVPDLIPLLTAVADSKKPLLIVTTSLTDDVLSLLIANKNNGGLNAVLVKIVDQSALQNQLLDDIALITGAEFLSAGKGYTIPKASIKELGMCSKAVVDKDKTAITIAPQSNNSLADTIVLLKERLQTTKGQDEINKLEKRLQVLSGSVATLYVGGTTETEMVEKKARAEDAVRAVEAAIDEGIAPGGGAAFLHSMKQLRGGEYLYKGEKAGIEILKKVLVKPFQVLLQNAGLKPNPLIETIQQHSEHFGYNLHSQKIDNLFEAGVIDPVRVLRLSLENAYSIVAQLLATQCSITENIHHDRYEKTELKAAIERKIKMTENAIEDYKEMTKPVAPDVAIGRLSRMDAINNKSVMEAALREAEAKLIRLQGALGRIEDPDFGTCSKCKQQIPFNRLKIMPESNSCMNCAK